MELIHCSEKKEYEEGFIYKVTSDPNVEGLEFKTSSTAWPCDLEQVTLNSLSLFPQ